LEMKVFYFIKYFNKGFMDYFNKINTCEATIVFDLEDSILDVSCEEKTKTLKQKYRKILQELATTHQDILQNHCIGIRTNPITSDAFKEDVILLQQLKDVVQWETIILPKVEYRSEVESLIDILQQHNIGYKAIGILSETVVGLSNLRSIIYPKIEQVEYVIFGHADYNKDLNIFPFINHDHPTYWEWVKEVQSQLEDTDITYINSPCLFLNDEGLFNFNLRKLHHLSTMPIGQMTLSYKQTVWCNTFPRTTDFKDEDLRFESNVAAVDSAAYAHSDAEKSDKGFMINDQHYVLSPHEIQMARKNLKMSNEA